jgi:hypothetical protein
VPRLLRIVLLAFPALLVVGVAVARVGEVVERGVQLPFFQDYDEISRVRLLGIELYVDTSSGFSDLVTASAFAFIAAGALAGARAIADPRVRQTFVVAGLGIAYLGADDLLAIHETVGHNLSFLAGLPAVDHPDDVIVGLYGLVLCAFAWRHRDLLTGPALRPFLVAVVCGGAAVLHDITALNLRLLEESLEVAAACALVAAGVLVAREHMVLGRRRTGPVSA